MLIKNLFKICQFLCKIHSRLARDEFQLPIVLTLTAVDDHLKTGTNKVHRSMQKGVIERITNTGEILFWEIGQYKGRE